MKGLHVFMVDAFCIKMCFIRKALWYSQWHCDLFCLHPIIRVFAGVLAVPLPLQLLASVHRKPQVRAQEL